MPDEPREKQRVLAERYRLVEQLGSGGFGTIWKADHLVLEAPVAVKLIAPEVAEEEGAVERFLREAKAAAALRSPHVVQILDYGVDAGAPFMVMELLEGETLAQRLRRLGTLGAESTVKIITHVCRAMARAHAAGIVHRDLKPENVFIVDNEGEELAKVLDFGVAKLDKTFAAGSARTRTGSLLGTPYYMSPEQVQGTKEVDHRSDLWSIGVIAYECLLGRKPFVSDGLGELVLQICVRPLPVPSNASDQLPREFDAWFARALQRDPEQRFQSASEQVTALRESLGVEVGELPASGGEEDLPSVASIASAPTMRPPKPGEAGAMDAREPDVVTLRLGHIVREELARSAAADRPSSTVWVALIALVLGMVGGGVYLYSSPLRVQSGADRDLPVAAPKASGIPLGRAAAAAAPAPATDGGDTQPDAATAPASRAPRGHPSSVTREPPPDSDEVDAGVTDTSPMLHGADAGPPVRPAMGGGGAPTSLAPLAEGGSAPKSDPAPSRPEWVTDAGAANPPYHVPSAGDD